jgi:hypothetical protein
VNCQKILLIVLALNFGENVFGQTATNFRFGLTVEAGYNKLCFADSGFSADYSKVNASRSLKAGIVRRVDEKSSVQVGFFSRKMSYGYKSKHIAGLQPAIVIHPLVGIDFLYNHALLQNRFVSLSAFAGPEVLAHWYYLKNGIITRRLDNASYTMYEIEAATHDTVSISYVENLRYDRLAFNVFAGASLDLKLHPKITVYVNLAYHQGLNKVYRGRFDINRTGEDLNAIIRFNGTHLSYYGGLRYNFNLKRISNKPVFNVSE